MTGPGMESDNRSLLGTRERKTRAAPRMGRQAAQGRNVAILEPVLRQRRNQPGELGRHIGFWRQMLERAAAAFAKMAADRLGARAGREDFLDLAADSELRHEFREQRQPVHLSGGRAQ